MASRYITLKKSDSEFLDYLWGRHQQCLVNNLVALPIKTYNLGTPEESVTFELKASSEVIRPNFFLYFVSLIKLNSFILILFPMFYVLSKNYLINGIADPLSSLFAAGASLFLFSGLNIRNDVNDHISGFDRVNLDSLKKPIRLGWISARAASRISLFLIGIAAVLALPIVLIHLKLIWLIFISVILLLAGNFVKNNSYKYQHFGEFILFILIGPALVSGYQIAAGGELDFEILSFGTLWGLIVIFLIQINNFSHIMTSSLAGIRNTMTKLGFDLSQKFLIWYWGFILVIWFYFHNRYSNIYWAIGGTFLLVLYSVPLYLKITNIKSPMGSGLQEIRRQSHKTFLFMLFIVLSENLWSLWAKSF